MQESIYLQILQDLQEDFDRTTKIGLFKQLHDMGLIEDGELSQLIESIEQLIESNINSAESI